jgi:hypothetical protein
MEKENERIKFVTERKFETGDRRPYKPKDSFLSFK